MAAIPPATRSSLLDTSSISPLSLSTAIIGQSGSIAASLPGDISTDGNRAFTYQGINLKPLSPIALTGNRDASNDGLSWIRRTRTGGEWRDYVDAMLGETSEAYQIDIFSDGTYPPSSARCPSLRQRYRLHQRRPDDRFRQQPGHALSQDLPTLRHRLLRLSAHAINYEVAMSSSTTLLDLIAQSQSSKEVTANALADAGSPATLFGRRASLCSGLNWFITAELC